MDFRARRSREASPDRAGVYVQTKTRMLRKVRVVYYLCRNGLLEHPHFMEFSHLANQQLRLKDVIDRLAILRGRGMVSLFSWSSKRSYKNGYVWNDLSENDVMYPAEGAEYVLKGSEIIDGCTERHPQVSPRQQNPEPSFPPKRKPHPPVQTGEIVEEEKHSNSSSNTSRCSRGISTDQTNENENTKAKNNTTEIRLDDDSLPSSSSMVSEKNQTHNASTTQRLEYDSGSESAMTRNGSVFLQLIACGSISARKNGSSSVTRAINSSESRKSSSMGKGVLCKTARSIEDEEIGYISENPRFGNQQSEDKDCCSGSIVESMTENRVGAEPSVMKSSSSNEERSEKSGLGEEMTEKSNDGSGGASARRESVFRGGRRQRKISPRSELIDG